MERERVSEVRGVENVGEIVVKVSSIGIVG